MPTLAMVHRAVVIGLRHNVSIAHALGVTTSSSLGFDVEFPSQPRATPDGRPGLTGSRVASGRAGG